MKRLKRFVIFLIVLTAVVWIVRIWDNWHVDKAHLEEQVKDSINEQLKKNENPLAALGRALYGMDECVEVSLLKESNNKYQGIATFKSGASKPVSVIIDGDQFMWKLI